MAKSMAAGVKAAWQAAKKDFKENTHSETLKRDVREVLEIAKGKASAAAAAAAAKRGSPASQKKLNSAASGSKAIGPPVNQDVGAELLTHFKDEWAEIHHSSEQASRTAAEMDSDLRRLHRSTSESHAIISRCREEFTHLRDIVEALDEAQSKVEAISSLIKQVEQDIRNYSQAKAALSMERQKHTLQRQHERDITENRSKVEHLRKVLGNERQLSLTVKYELEDKQLKERQMAFQELFDKQMADYRTRGEVDKPIGGETRERSASHLDEMVIEDEDGTASLHEFLSDVVLEDGSSPAEAKEEGGGEGEEGSAKDKSAKDEDKPEQSQEDAPSNLA